MTRTAVQSSTAIGPDHPRAARVLPGSEDPTADLDGALIAVMGGLVCGATVATPATSGATILLLPPGPVGRMRGRELRMRHRELLCAASDDFAAAMTHIQHALGEGPDVDVLADTRAAVAANAAVEVDRWPVFAVVARAHQLGAVHAEPLLTPDRNLLGVITWFAKVAGEFTGGRHDLPARARRATHTLALARRLIELEVPADGLGAALAARRVISQATGVLMEHHSCSSTDAFTRLQDVAQRHGMTLGTAAAVVVDRAVRTARRAPGLTLV